MFAKSKRLAGIAALAQFVVHFTPRVGFAAESFVYRYEKVISEVYIAHVLAEYKPVQVCTNYDFSGNGEFTACTGYGKRPGIALTVRGRAPTCARHHALVATLKLRYENGNAHVTRTFTLGESSEGQDFQLATTAEGYFGDLPAGRTTMTISSTCKDKRAPDWWPF